MTPIPYRAQRVEQMFYSVASNESLSSLSPPSPHRLTERYQRLIGSPRVTDFPMAGALRHRSVIATTNGWNKKGAVFGAPCRENVGKALRRGLGVQDGLCCLD